MAQSLSEGSVFNYTTTGAVTNGQLVVLGRMAGVALNSATGAGQKVALALDGVHSLAAIATGTKALGLPVGYRTSGGLKVSAVAAGCTGVAWSATGGVQVYGTKYCIGTIWEAAASAATSVKVRLHGGPLAALL
jgi:predicted RecA/RadA family phage recombinase